MTEIIINVHDRQINTKEMLPKFLRNYEYRVLMIWDWFKKDFIPVSRRSNLVQ